MFDFHMHTCFSGDSDAPVRDMIEGAIQKGLDTICFTDHNDPDFPPCDVSFDLDTDAYFQAVRAFQEEYHGKIDIRFGVELGLQPHLAETLSQYVQRYPFDFVIGSSHLADRQDPYDPAFFEDRSEHDAYSRYFLSVAENLQAFSDFDSYGHLDYVVRYGPNRNANYTYSAYADELDAALKMLIEKQVGLEVNTAGYKYGLGVPHPIPDIIRRYLELGGECITIGADAHKPEYIAYAFGQTLDLLKSCGVRYLCTFEKRKPTYHMIQKL